MASHEEVRRRRARALTLSAAGMAPADIAEQEARETGKAPRSAKAVAADIARALRDREEIGENERELLIALELERLDSLQRATEALLRVARNDREQSLALRAVDRLLRIGERRSALLGLDAKFGMEAPKQVTEIDEIRKRRDAKMRELG